MADASEAAAAERVLAELIRAHVEVWLEAGELRYVAPRGALTPALRADIRDNRAALCGLLANGMRHAPPSAGQQALWFLQERQPESAFYSMPIAYRLWGKVQADQLERAFRRLVERHESLRSTFRALDGTPVLMIGAGSEGAEFVIEDIASHSDPERLVRQRAEAEAARPFDLSRPLIRARFSSIRADEHVLLLNQHHIISDFWSCGVIIHDLLALYEHEAGAAPLPPEPGQFSIFRRWEAARMRDGGHELPLRYWTTVLARDTAPAALPLDRPRPEVQSFRGAWYPFVLDGETTRGLQGLSQRAGATLFTTLLSLLYVLLHRHSGSTDLSVGAATANRRLPNTQSAVGLFANTVVMRVDLAGCSSFDELLARTGAVVWAALEHQDVPFERVVRELKPRRTSGRNPLFDIMFSFLNTPARDSGSIRAEHLPLDTGGEHFDLSLILEERAGVIQGAWRYSTDLFDPRTIQRLARQLQVLAVAVVAGPSTPISRLPLLSPAEQREVLDASRSPAELEASDVMSEFAAAVASSPSAVALVAESASGEMTEWSFAALDQAANALAWSLHEAGLGAESRVAILAPRGERLVSSVLAALKIGAAFVGIDPEYPDERVEHMLKGCGASVIVAAGGYEGRAERALPGRLIRCAPGERRMEAPPCGARSENAAYLVYTSGSTGLPKAVVATRGSLSHYVRSLRRALGVRAGDRYLHTASFSFSSSVRQLLLPLASGASVVVAPHGAMADPSRVLGLLTEHVVSIVDLTPTYWQALLEALEGAGSGVQQALRAGPLRLALAASEPLPPQLASGWQRRVGTGAFVNMYGATETTGIVATHSVALGAPDDGRGHAVPLGLPVTGASLYLLDGELAPVPHGMTGEIFVGGAGVARGYHGDPRATAEAFVPDPFSDRPGARMFRTGDHGYRRADGVVIATGRRDGQVKVRGVRVEVAEVEAVLRRHPDVREVAVAAVDDEVRGRQLGCHLVLRTGAGDTSVASKGVRAFAARHLPAAFVPAFWTILPRLPRTANGKIDRARLVAGAPVATAGSVSVADEAPTNDMERALAEVWSQVLRAPNVGIHQNFFDLGGDSLLSARLVSKARAQGIVIGPDDVFRHQTIAELARVVREARAATDDAAPAAGPLPLTPIEHWFFERALTDRARWNMPFFLRLRGGVRPRPLRRALEALVEHHAALRLRYSQGAAGRWQRRVLEPRECVGNAAVAFRVAELAAAEDDSTLARHAFGDARDALDLEHGPLLGATLFQPSEGAPGYLLLSPHHLTIDGLSWRILLDDLDRAYRSASAGEEISLPAQTASLSRWALALEDYARSDELRSELSHWSEAARGRTDLPLDAGSSHDDTERFARVVERRYPAETSDRIARAFGARTERALLACLLVAVGSWTGFDSVTVELEGHGRESVLGLDVTRTMGWFTTIYPVTVSVGPERSPSGVLACVERAMASVPRNGFGYGVARYLHPDPAVRASLAAQPAPSLRFNYLGRFDAAAHEGSPFEQRLNSHIPGSRDPDGARPNLLRFDALILDGHLRTVWTYSERCHHRSTIESLAGAFDHALNVLLASAESESTRFASNDRRLQMSGGEMAALLRELAAGGHP